MEYGEALKAARGVMGPFCKACPVCDGKACGSSIPGPGAKGSGLGAVRNFQAWRNLYLNMDTIVANDPIDTEFEFFGRTFTVPVFAGPVGSVQMHYGDKFTDTTYNEVLVPACAEAGIAAFTGDGVSEENMIASCRIIGEAGGCGVPTVKPWDAETVSEKMALVHESNAFAVAMDVDAAGLPFLKGATPPAGRKSTDELRGIITDAGMPFIVKGVMTVAGALKALEAGAGAIVVSNHGGRVLDSCPATADVLPDIAQAVAGRMKILVDGGIRDGIDVFKALALGADGVIICRPFVNMVYGSGAQGVQAYVTKLQTELSDAMFMCGAATLADITPEMVRR